ncbi:hypothetical protein N7492_001082 [Penicillium capsulatum]|uniref:PXA domain-containing protein n=1 Tax=Penicillium capsulatum TaxID=69766 RepID=A0A9W9IX10_9EURO|nr:hypothetical protein N7492_001082 [Penicillium capsulatum]KAJ6129859.1 hypothetical protein N7512_002639 [Penicillium capsulatum]
MSDPLRPGMQPVSHLKTGPTTASSRLTALPSPTHPPTTRPSFRVQMQRNSNREEPYDPTGERATAALIRRVLCPQTSNLGASSSPSPEGLLPPLTSSNDVDRQLYAILAIIIKEFVYSWYSKITPDQALVNEVLQVVAHCTRALEQRIRQVDVAQLMLDEIPALVEAHILSYRISKRQSHLSGLTTSHRALYHELNPHPGLSPIPDETDPDTITAQAENEAVYRRLLASGILAVLLPTEDLENSSLRAIVSDVLADLILGKEVAGRMCEEWFIWETITKLADRVKRPQFPSTQHSTNESSLSRLERFGLLSVEDKAASPQLPAQSRSMTWIWNVLQTIYVGYLALCFIATGLVRVASNRRPASSHGAGVSFPAATPSSKVSLESSDGVTGKRPVLDYRFSSMVSQLLGIPQRMPWLSGCLSLGQHLVLAGPGRLGDTDGVLDRFLRDTIDEYVLPPTLLPNLLLATRSALFPANARPASLGLVKTGASGPAPAPQMSVQPPTFNGKALTTAAISAPPIAEGVGVPVAATAAAGNGHADGSKHSSSSSDSNGSSGVDHLPPGGMISTGAATLSSKVDASAELSTSIPAGSEKSFRPSDSEIAAIKRRCAVSLLAVIPRQVARTLLGVPAPSNRARTCSTTTDILPSNKKAGGDPRSSPPAEQRTSPLANSCGPDYSGGPDEDSGNLTADRGRTDSQNEHTEDDPEEGLLLRTIESELLDLLGDAYCNKHLIYAILETVLAKILPEVSERSVETLMEDRGVPPVPGGF